MTKCFAEEKDDESKLTIVINASNANSGKANRLVSGAVIIDVEGAFLQGRLENGEKLYMQSRMALKSDIQAMWYQK